MKKQIQETAEQLIILLVLIVFTVIFFKTESPTMWAIGLLLFCLTIKVLMLLVNNLISIYIDVKFILPSKKKKNKTLV